MKKIILPLVLFASLLCLLASFIHTSRTNTGKYIPAKISTPVSCASVTTSISGAEYFKLHPIPSTVMIRKNIYSLSAAQISSIKTGIAAMKLIEYHNPLSWDYQAAIHWTLRTDGLPSWKSCKHGSPFFLSWHRMYLYFFERILRAKSGDPNLTLPYWDYQTNPVLPPAYRDATPGNPLYDGTRYTSINGGGAIPSGILTDFSNALHNNIDFYTFSTDLEGPHGTVHTSIGGNMFDVRTAALDPCFWLHHSNIDRLWQEWLSLCGGRANPTDNAFLTQSFTFFDENGTAVVMTGSQILNTSKQMNYKYDVPLIKLCAVGIPWRNWKWRPIYLIHIPPIPIDDTIMRVPMSGANLEALKEFVKTPANQKFFYSKTGFMDLIYLEMEDIKIEQRPEGVVEVYINLPKGQAPSPKSRSFAGVVNFFGAIMDDNHMDHPMVSKMNITHAIRALGLQPADLAKVSLSFYTRGIIMRGKEMKTRTAIEIGKTSIVLQKAQR